MIYVSGNSVQYYGGYSNDYKGGTVMKTKGVYFNDYEGLLS